jgi:ADP-L-glycero-D-manno-heptose 6-epimerase
VSAGAPVVLFRSRHPHYADGEQRRDFILVDDCAEVVAWLIEHEAISGIYNIGTGQSRSFAELARALLAACGHAERITFVDPPPELEQHYQYFTQANLGRLRAAGYDRPFATIETGVHQYVERYLSRPDRYR